MMVGVLPRLSGFFALIGNVVVLFGPAPSWLVASFAAVSLVVLITILGWRPRWRRPGTILALVVLCSAGVTAFCVLDRQERRWPSEAAGERVIGEITIDSLPTREGGVL